MSDSKPRRRADDLEPRPAMWQGIGGDRGLRAILTDFYTRVYADPRLGPFFVNATKDRAIDKQHAFIRQILTGERLYFGERPRNAHHWMVISDELFDYREDLLEACLRDHGVSDEHVREWRAIDEIFRKQIVKMAPVPKKVRGVALPLEGYESLVLSIGSLCDDCGAEMPSGSTATFHVRTGKTFCATCITDRGGEPVARGQGPARSPAGA